MKNYNLELQNGTAIIEVTIQKYRFRGNYRIKIETELKGTEILEDAFETEWLGKKDIISSDCNFQVDEENGIFKVDLKEIETGKIEHLENSLLFLPQLIVGVKIIEYKK